MGARPRRRAASGTSSSASATGATGCCSASQRWISAAIWARNTLGSVRRALMDAFPASAYQLGAAIPSVEISYPPPASRPLRRSCNGRRHTSQGGRPSTASATRYTSRSESDTFGFSRLTVLGDADLGDQFAEQLHVRHVGRRRHRPARPRLGQVPVQPIPQRLALIVEAIVAVAGKRPAVPLARGRPVAGVTLPRPVEWVAAERAHERTRRERRVAFLDGTPRRRSGRPWPLLQRHAVNRAAQLRNLGAGRRGGAGAAISSHGNGPRRP